MNSMRHVLLLTLFTFLTLQLLGQDKIEIFITTKGERFTKEQRDSLERIGNFVGIKETHFSGDTIYRSIFYYDKTFLLTPFQKRHQGKKFPRANLKSPAGKWIDTDQMNDKPLVVHFWSTGLSWEEVSQLNHLLDEFKDKSNFLSICSDSENEMLKELSQFRFKFEIVAEGQKICDELGISSYPTIFIIDKSGTIKEVMEGVPVKTNADGTLSKPEGEIQFIIYETYSKILRDVLNGKSK